MTSSAAAAILPSLVFVVAAARVVAQAPPNDDCSAPAALYDGVNPAPPAGAAGATFSNVGATDAAGFGVDCAAPGHFNKDVFFVYVATHTGTTTVATCAPPGLSGGSLADTVLAAYDPAACSGGGAALACNDQFCGPRSSIAFPTVAGATYLVRVGSWSAGMTGSFRLTVGPPPPANDDCAGALPIFDGVNPSPPSGAPGASYSNAGAADSAGFSASTACAAVPGSRDVFFSYVSTVDGPVRVSLRAPPGLPAGSLADALLEIYPAGSCPTAGAPPLACDDDACGGLSEVAFPAVFGAAYLVRVAALGAAAAVGGTFRVTVDPVENDACATAQPASFGIVVGSTFDADATNPSPSGCVAATVPDVWYLLIPPVTCDVAVEIGGAADRLAVYVGACGALTEVGCAVAAPYAVVLVGAAAGTPYFVRVGRTGAGPAGAFSLSVSCAPPPNDDCAQAIPLFDGTNPAPPNGSSGATFSNYGATTTSPFSAPSDCPGSGPGHPGHNDVFFSYVATAGGPTRISMCPSPYPNGFVFDSLLEVYAAADCPGGSATPLACDDQGCGGLSQLTFAATAGVAYLVRVSSWATFEGAEGEFRLEVDPASRLEIDAPAGPGSVRVRNLGGPPFAFAATVLTLLAGTYPNGPFFGIDPSFTEIVLQAASGVPPFVNVLDADGNSTFGPVLGAPPIAIYGVSLALNAFGQIGEVTPPVAFSVP